MTSRLPSTRTQEIVQSMQNAACRVRGIGDGVNSSGYRAASTRKRQPLKRREG